MPWALCHRQVRVLLKWLRPEQWRRQKQTRRGESHKCKDKQTDRQTDTDTHTHTHTDTHPHRVENLWQWPVVVVESCGSVYYNNNNNPLKTLVLCLLLLFLLSFSLPPAFPFCLLLFLRSLPNRAEILLQSRVSPCAGCGFQAL